MDEKQSVWWVQYGVFLKDADGQEHFELERHNNSRTAIFREGCSV